jgi:hypothetical protein
MSHRVWENYREPLLRAIRRNTANLELVMKHPEFIDGKRILKTHAVRHIEPTYEKLAKSLGEMPELKYIKVFPNRVAASNILSQDKKKNPL